MKKRKSTGKFLSRLLCLVTVMGMLVPMALADELGKVPGSSDTNTYEKADIKVEISVVKHVQQTGTETPPAETFEFEVEDTARGEQHPLSYYGIGVAEWKAPIVMTTPNPAAAKAGAAPIGNSSDAFGRFVFCVSRNSEAL